MRFESSFSCQVVQQLSVGQGDIARLERLSAAEVRQSIVNRADGLRLEMKESIGYLVRSARRSFLWGVACGLIQETP